MRTRLLLAGLLLFGCTAAPLATPADDLVPTLPPIPDTIPSTLGPVRVFRPDSIAYGEPGSVTLGAFLPQPRVIFVKRGMSRAVTWQVLLHERCHLELYDAGLKLDDADEDRVCDAWGNADVRDFAFGALTIRGR